LVLSLTLSATYPSVLFATQDFNKQMRDLSFSESKNRIDEESDESNPASPVAPAGELEPGPGSAAAAEGGATDHLVAEAAPEPEPEGGE
jgi:hypothetical protein